MHSRILLVITLVACGPKTVATPSPAPPEPPVAKASPTPSELSTELPPDAADPPPPRECDAQVADVPTALFGDRILIRPPVNVELVEDNPTMATTFSTFVSTCEATVDRMSLFVFANDRAKPLSAYFAEFRKTLDASGYKGGVDSSISSSENELMTAIEYPAADGQPPAKVLVAVSRKFDNVLIVFYQTQPDQWPGLANSFIASAKTLLISNP